MSTLTTNYSFIKPAVFSDVDLWGGYLNTSLDSIDTQIKTTDNFAQAALPKVGGTMSGNIAMGTFKLSGLGTGTAATDSTTVSQNQSNIAGHAFSTGGTVDALTAIMSPVTTAYSTHFFYRVTSIGPNTIVAPTINIDGLGVKTIKKGANANLAVGDTGAAGYEMLLGYNGTNIILLNPPSPVILGANTFTAGQTIDVTSAATNTVVPALLSRIVRSSGTVAVGFGGYLDYLSMQNAAGTLKSGSSSIVTAWTNATAAAEATLTSITGMIAGAVLTVLNIGAGVYTPNATGGDKGIDTINTKNYYIDGNLAAPPVLLNTLTAAASVSLQDTTSFTAAYRYYDIILENIVPVTSGSTLLIQPQVSAAFQTAVTSMFTMTDPNNAGNASLSQQFNGVIGQVSDGIVNTAGAGFSAKMTVMNPLSTTTYKQMLLEGAGFGAATTFFTVQGGLAYIGSLAAVTGLKFIMSAGNISTGVIKIYGRN